MRAVHQFHQWGVRIDGGHLGVPSRLMRQQLGARAFLKESSAAIKVPFSLYIVIPVPYNPPLNTIPPGLFQPPGMLDHRMYYSTVQ
jgi:hypothetical protein